MGRLLVVPVIALAFFIGGGIAAWAVLSHQSAWSVRRIMNRQQREIMALRERVARAEAGGLMGVDGDGGTRKGAESDGGPGGGPGARERAVL